MGFFGKLFEKAQCGVCGGEIGMMGKYKLDDSVICKVCAGKLSPFFSGRRRSTLADINAHLAYREENKTKVAAFNPTRTLGDRTKVVMDEDAGLFFVTSASRWREANPDIMTFAQVTGCDTEIREERTEIKQENSDGSKSSYNPPRYDIDYDFHVTIHVNHPWFDEIEFKVNSGTVDIKGSMEYQEAERHMNEIREALTQARQGVRDRVAAAAAPKTAVSCRLCGATTTPDASGRCEYCGGAAA